MKFLITGASGMVGHLVALYLEEQGHQVVGYCRREAPISTVVRGDLYDIDLISEVIKKGEFDIVVNAAGLLVADCENDKSSGIYVNAYVPHLLAKLANENGARLIQLSTDCVFSGNTGPYTEGTRPDGEEMYAKTKALGEVRYEPNLTLRNSVVGPDISPAGIGLLNWFMQQEDVIEGWEKAIWTGMTTLETATVIDFAAKNDAYGLVNMVPASPINKYDLLQLFKKYLRNDDLHIEKTDWFVSDKALTRTNYALDWEVPSYEKMVCDMMGWINAHRDIYPDYYYRH